MIALSSTGIVATETNCRATRSDTYHQLDHKARDAKATGTPWNEIHDRCLNGLDWLQPSVRVRNETTSSIAFTYPSLGQHIIEQ